MKIHNKLVRDKIPFINQENWVGSKYRVLNQREFKKELKKKLVEEAKELVGASPTKIREEIVDVYEVLLNIAKVCGVRWSMVEQFRKEKNKKRGSFKKKYFLVSTRK